MVDILKHDAIDEVKAAAFATGLSSSPTPSSSTVDELRDRNRQKGIDSLYFFTTGVLGWDKLEKEPHKEMCDFIQSPARRKVLLVPRDCYKSTIASKSLPLWYLIQPSLEGMPGLEHRILLASHSSQNAKKNIRSLRTQVEKNTVLQWLYPEIIPNFGTTTWTDTNLLFPREGAYGEDTIECGGIDTHLVSRHYTIQIKDDLEDHASFESPTIRERVKTWYRAAEALFVDEQTSLDVIVGTRWGANDLYSEIFEHESETYERMVRPLHWDRTMLEMDIAEAEKTGKPSCYNMDPDTFAPDPLKTYLFFPRLFPSASCARIRKKQGPTMYFMLYMNNPKDESLMEFRKSDLRFCEFTTDGEAIRLQNEDGVYEDVLLDDLMRIQLWDPALTEEKIRQRCRNAIVVSASDRRGRIFFLDAHAAFKEPTAFINRFIGYHQRYMLHRSAVEDAGFQRILKFPIYHRMRELSYLFPVHGAKPRNNQTKEARIRSLIPFVEGHNCYIVRSRCADLIEEMEGFPQHPTRDALDAAASSIELHGSRIYAEDNRAEERRRDRAVQSARSAVTGY